VVTKAREKEKKVNSEHKKQEKPENQTHQKTGKDSGINREQNRRETLR